MRQSGGGSAARAGGTPQQATPKDIARFLIHLKPLVARAIEVRQSWIRELSALDAEVKTGSAAQVTARAGRLGREHVTSFREIRSSTERHQAPEGCQEINRIVFAWLDSLVKACDALVEVGSTGQMAGLKIVQQHVSDARASARRFNSEYQRLISELNVAVRAARRR
ncbi:MAG: hypothetical protein EPO26_03580 [Chloroflexota bacterium]|nr:MAG: hypothetical protein EPO26_03580 [Chloroflexota bacterium]